MLDTKGTNGNLPRTRRNDEVRGNRSILLTSHDHVPRLDKTGLGGPVFDQEFIDLGLRLFRHPDASHPDSFVQGDEIAQTPGRGVFQNINGEVLMRVRAGDLQRFLRAKGRCGECECQRQRGAQRDE